MSNRVKLDWDGELIKQSIIVEDIKFSPKDIIDSIDNVGTSIDGLKNQKSKMQENIKKIEQDLHSAKSFLNDRMKFEEKCVKLSMGKLEKYFASFKEELMEESTKAAKEIISRDPSAYTDQQANNQHYVIFQKLFAQHPKVAKNIPKRLITNRIFDKPFFENPFKIN